jgi:hypothetical protein
MQEPKFVDHCVREEDGILEDLITHLSTVRVGTGYSYIFLYNSRLAYTSPSNIYDDATVCCPIYGKNQWHSVLAITPNEFVISNSNSFYWQATRYDVNAWQNVAHRIYDRLIYTYHRAKNTPLESRQLITQESFLLANPFEGTNSGHDLSIIFDAVVYIRAHPTIKRVVILKAAEWFPSNLTLLKFLLKDGPEIWMMDWNMVYRFSKIHIIKQEILNIRKHHMICDEILARAISVGVAHQRRKVVLLKTHRDQNVITTRNQLICAKLLADLESHGYMVVQPETTADIMSLIAVLHNATEIITGKGAILYTHMVFFNPNAVMKLILMEGEQMTGPYALVASRTKKTVILKQNEFNLDANPALSTQVLTQLV